MKRQILKAIMLAVFVTATLNLGAQFYRAYCDSLERERLYREHGAIACKLGLSMDEASRFYIELTLFIALCGSRIKNLKGRLLYNAGLIATIAFYIFWWRYYFVLAEISEAEMKFVRHIAYLYNATYWDICIVMAISMLLLWEIKCLVSLPFRPTSHST